MALKWILLVLSMAVSALAEIEMEFTKWPESVSAPVGDEVTFECEVNVPGEKLTWRFRPLDEDRWRDVQDPYESNSATTRLTVQVHENGKAGFYQCVVWYGGIVLVSVPGKLSVAKLDLSRNVPEKRVIVAPLKSTVTLHCRTPTSRPPAVLSWWKEDKGTKKPIDSWQGVLVMINVTTEDSGTYGCTATNELSGQTEHLPEITYLKVQHESRGNIRFLETDDYVGTIDKEGVLTMPVKAHSVAHLFCGVVGNPQPNVTWSRQNGDISVRAKSSNILLSLPMIHSRDEGLYTCTAGHLKRSWKVKALQRAFWDGKASNVNGTEGSSTKVSCGRPVGQPPPEVYWLMNGRPVKDDPSIRTSGSDLYIHRTEKRHASIVQCFACNEIGCAYEAALVTVVPMQISDQDYSIETGRTHYVPVHTTKRHNRKNPRKHATKVTLIPPSRPNVTRMSDESVMVSWTSSNDGLRILFFKVQYKEVTNNTMTQWNTDTEDIVPHAQSHVVKGLTPDRYYKFRVSAVYSNQDNKQGKSSGKFYLQRGSGFTTPNRPVVTNATALSPEAVLINWTWTNTNNAQVEGFYVYYRAVSSAGVYSNVIAPGGAAARSIVLTHLTPDTGYEVKTQSYTAQAPSEFSSITTVKTQRKSTPPPPAPPPPPAAPSGALLPAGGAAGAALLAALAAALLFCRRTKKPHRDKEKGNVPEGGTGNGYIPAKVPMTITANPMHAEGSDGSVEMSFIHNNNTGNEENTLQHSRKNGSASRKYV